MLKQALLFSLVASALMAGQYATLKDGRTIIMHENGTWEEVQVVQSSNGQVGVMAAKDIAGSTKAISVEEPIARMLVGQWSDKNEELKYNFRNNGTVTYTIDGTTKTEAYSIQAIDDKDNTISISIGDSSRYGKVIFGGLLRKLKISKDGQSAIDYSDELTKFKTVTLQKIGGAEESKTNIINNSSSNKKANEPSSTNGFVK